VGDAGLKHIAAAKQLERLYLDNTQVTDAGLKNLLEMRQLEDVYCHGTKVTEAGVRNLQEALPKCRIHHKMTSKKKRG
jgi:hypothetical protein